MPHSPVQTHFSVEQSHTSTLMSTVESNLEPRDTLACRLEKPGIEPPTFRSARPHPALPHELQPELWNQCAKMHFLPCSPHPSWPYSSTLQHHKWRHLVSCRGEMKEESDNKEMEITDLDLNDDRGRATREQNDKKWWTKQHWDNVSTKKTDHKGFFSRHHFCTNLQQSHNKTFINGRRDVISPPTIAWIEHNWMHQ